MPIDHNIKSIKIDSPLLINANFGRKIDAMKAVQPWLDDPRTKKTWLATKRTKVITAINRFKKTCKEYWIQYPEQTANWSDDSVQIYYRDE
jgi:hypothetical protein